jgi:tetratricopeptide (TPR) repeat protein
MMTALPNTRRWRRHEVDLPVRVFARGLSHAVPGRGTELSAGGMALYAGVELKTSQKLEVEFVAPSRARVAGIVRYREGYCFGLEFLTPLPIDSEIRAAARWPGTQLGDEPGPLSKGAYELFQKIKKTRGNAAAYGLLAHVLTLAGRRDEARKAADRALAFHGDENNRKRAERHQQRENLLQELQALRGVMALLAEAFDRGVIDERLPRLLKTIPGLLRP